MANEDDFFRISIQNRNDITSRYLNRLALVNEVVGDSPNNATLFRRIIREQLEDKTNGYIGKFDELPRDIIDNVREWQRDGLIGAVDGTDSIRPTLLPDKIVYGVAISTATSKLQTAPKITITHTFKQQKTPDNIDDLFSLQDALQDSSEKPSWMRTYREYEEREAALDLLNQGCRLILIDGPIYTQNLMTQRVAQERVLDRLQQNKTNFIGYIKEQNPFHKHLGAALHKGEYFVFNRFKDLLASNRFREQDNHPAVAWIKKSPHWVRCIYKINQKAFEFECTPEMVPHGLALIRIDCSDALDHDIPFLLELVDRYARANTDASNVGRDLLQALGEFTLTFENEREFR